MTWSRKIGIPLGMLAFIALLLALPALSGTERTQLHVVLAMAAWMIIWWVTEAYPIYLTALIPMIVLPAFGVGESSDAFEPYASPIIFLFLGGFLMALAMEERRLHERIAFGLIRLTGTKPSGIVMGFIASTALVAMWISNTATTVMMLPIALSVVRLMQERLTGTGQFRAFALVLMLSIAYAANIGGMMTLIGTPPNMVFAGFYAQHTGAEFGFARWLAFGVPVGVLMLGVMYVLLTKVLFRISNSEVPEVQQVFEEKWRQLGPMDKGEKRVLAVFSLTVLCWIFLDPINQALGARVLTNTNIAMTGGLMMFFIPVDWRKGEFILHWESTARLPWGILLLFGGGLALANALEHVGIIKAMAHWVSANVPAQPFFIASMLCLLALILTEFMSNVALVTVLIPVVLGIAEQLDLPITYLAIPVTLAASCAFMMPISTPPNAIVFASGYIRSFDMARAGFWSNLCAVLLILVVNEVVHSFL